MTVAAGDTLYSISRRYGVSVMQLMETNQLSDSNIAMGQKLYLPAGATTASVSTQARTQPTSSARLVARSSGAYTVKSGESFRDIARKLGVDAARLADVNGITDTGSLRPGEVLIVPVQSAASVHKHAVKKRVASETGLKVRAVKTKKIRMASLKQDGLSMTDAGGATFSKMTTVRRKPAKKTPNKKASRRPSGKHSSSKTSIASFRWPVRGRIISRFGSRGDGTHNDGVNLAVPAGTKVKAAKEGVVAYAGSELKGYGKLVLIRHSNGWVSAYAHNQEIMVKRGQHIKRGQVISRAGKTGSVTQPQVHFELRKGSRPVDPMKYMSGA